jgi:hypothetical protein
MTNNEINKILAQLAENPSRDNVLAFAFALLQWMNIEPNAGSKPQLLSPQTQKLKDFLVPAPQTVQPQLYRLSADKQNIRVRFAVLKKLKKDYISQLVDNDPGLSSYQSLIKGITAITPASGGTVSSGFIPTQPYFIHFVTTPDYDKLVLIFNQGEQKRIVTFRKQLTNTQYNKIIQQWQGVGTKTKPEIAELLWKSLDIKEVNKEFYKQIKERFDALLGILIEPEFTRLKDIPDSNTVKQFAVRLIGRYIFCWFLKEKEIVPPGLISSEYIRNNENYYQAILLPLFFKTLNTKVQDREILKSFNPDNQNPDKIPYLNGGLFDESEEDKLFASLNLDAWLLPFVEILESYDFTVDESSSQYQQIAVDPEMLGRIFENLLASQNEETSTLANQRKAFGAFYTPREIVDYMVNESIKAYLQTQWEQQILDHKTKSINNPEQVGDIFGNKKPQQLSIEIKRYELKQEDKEKIEKAIAPLFYLQPGAEGLKKDEKGMLLTFLEQIKILDPACGSGAFPMGILHKLVELNEVLGTVKSSYELKKDILSRNIYGVDIMPMAIEIARLRAWLSLVLEEDYKPNDPRHNFGVKPLPNLDFKFVCANSLIDLGLDAYLEEANTSLYGNFAGKLIKQLQELQNNRREYFMPELSSLEKEKVKEQFLKTREEIIYAILGEKVGTGKVSEPGAFQDDRLKQIAQKIKQWNPFDDSKPSPFFSPTWMFGVDKGFDVVIGNPPYLRIQSVDKGIKEYFSKNYVSATKNYDLYIVFSELSINLLKPNGNLIFIQPNKFFNADYGFGLRKFVTEKKYIRSIVDFQAEQVFTSATTYTCIFHCIKQQQEKFSYTTFSGLDKADNFLTFSCGKRTNDILTEEFNYTKHSANSWSFGTFSEQKIFSKIEKDSDPLSSFTEKIYQGLVTSSDSVYIIKKVTDGFYSKFLNKVVQLEDVFLKPLLKGSEIRRYKINFQNLFLIFPYQVINDKATLIEKSYFIKTYPLTWAYLKDCESKLRSREDGKMDHNEWYAYVYPKNLNDFIRPKIMTQVLAKRASMVFDENGAYYFVGGGNAGGYGIVLREGRNLSYLYLLGLLNSNLLNFYLQNHSSRFQNGYYSYAKRFIEKVPIKDIPNENQQLIIRNVEKILVLKKQNQETTTLEREIDVLVYKLYELNYDEVKIIDPDFWLIEEEYLNYDLN